jgi:CP family cyanate transporter-like MFS transporter
MSIGNSRVSISIVLTVIGIVFISINLRAPLTSISPVVNEIIAYMGLNNLEAGLITTLPLLAFGCLSIFAPQLASSLGLEKVLWYSMPVLFLGLVARASGNYYLLFIGASLIGVAITMGNVLMPAFIKLRFPEKMGLMTGINALCMNISGVLASGYSVKIGLMTGLGWKGSVGVWVIPALLGFLMWIPQLRFNKKNSNAKLGGFSELLKSRLAWYITIFMGLQSCLFYILVAWLPVVLQSWGMTEEEAGWSFSYIQMTQLPITLLGPILTARIKKHQPLIIFITLMMLLGVFGLVFFKTTYIIPSVICIGIGTGLAFSVVLMFFVLKTETPVKAAQLSGMAQSFGYLIAAASPPLFGLIYDFTADWTYSLLLFIPITLGMCWVALLSARDKYQIQ